MAYRDDDWQMNQVSKWSGVENEQNEDLEQSLEQNIIIELQ